MKERRKISGENNEMTKNENNRKVMTAKKAKRK